MAVEFDGSDRVATAEGVAVVGEGIGGEILVVEGAVVGLAGGACFVVLPRVVWSAFAAGSIVDHRDAAPGDVGTTSTYEQPSARPRALVDAQPAVGSGAKESVILPQGISISGWNIPKQWIRVVLSQHT
ncbi:hypothetical protein [Actinoallomurus sp. NPDC052274]|uniref:hypothetical protein n=1 Tax=Actinoallomurus sp. NPDC052274 TaxID=3155420 RepID=UPI0034293548